MQAVTYAAYVCESLHFDPSVPEFRALTGHTRCHAGDQRHRKIQRTPFGSLSGEVL